VPKKKKKPAPESQVANKLVYQGKFEFLFLGLFFYKNIYLKKNNNNTLFTSETRSQDNKCMLPFSETMQNTATVYQKVPYFF